MREQTDLYFFLAEAQSAQRKNPILKILFILSKKTFRAFRLPAVALAKVGVFRGKKEMKLQTRGHSPLLLKIVSFKIFVSNKGSMSEEPFDLTDNMLLEIINPFTVRSMPGTPWRFVGGICCGRGKTITCAGCRARSSCGESPSAA